MKIQVSNRVRTVAVLSTVCCTLFMVAAHARQNTFPFDVLFPASKQKEMGLDKLTETEKKALNSHVNSLISMAMDVGRGSSARSKVYASLGKGHWIKKNIERGKMIILEDGSIWEIDPIDKVNSMLWLAVDNIIVLQSSKGSPGYDYLLINTNNKQQAHAKYMGK